MRLFLETDAEPAEPGAEVVCFRCANPVFSVTDVLRWTSNVVERAIRPVTIEEDSLFAGSDAGARRWAI
jgi:hypothetical protein